MAIYFFDKNQTLMKIVPESATFEAIQTQELDDDSLLKDTLSVTVKGDEKLLNAEYMAVKSYTGNAQAFDMYRIVTDTTPDKSMSFTGMSLAPYELNGHILQDLRPANHSLSYTLNRVLDGTDWRVGYIEDGLSNVTTTFYYVSAKEALKELQSLVGCEFVFKVEISGQKITDKWIEVYSEMGNRTRKRFTYGTNALTVVRETNKADIYTALIGRGKGEEVSSGEDNESGQAGYGRKITFEDIEWSTIKGNPLNKPIGQYYLELPQATQAYGIKNIDGTMKARVGIVDFDDEEDKNRLINLTYQQLLVSSRPKVLFKTTVANIGATGIGDTVTIHRHDLNIHYQTRVRKIVRNKLNDNKTQIELGDAVVTPSTKQTKQNNATIKNLNNEIDKIKANVTTSQNSADGKNTIFYGSAEPERQRTGDTWYRPHPSIAGETQMLTWNGTAWELVIDTSDLTSVSMAVEDASRIAGEAVQAAKDADEKANSAIEKAGANARLLTTHQNTIDTINTVTLPDITSTVGDALANAKDAMDEAKLADGKIANFVTTNGLVSGTTVDSKIDTVKGEISGKITTLETNKLDSTTYTNFYENDYKLTAQGVTDTYTKVNKIIDEDGNTTDTFAKAVYDRNATRQTLSFNEVTKDLVTTTTYENGIDGVKNSITSVRGDLDSLSGGGRNYAIDTSNTMKYYLQINAYSGHLDQDNKLTSKTKYTLDELDAKVGDWYTASIYIGKGGGYGSSVIVYNQNTSSVRLRGNGATSGYSSVTFQILEGDTEFNFFLGNESGNNATYYIEAKEFQIEKGKIRTAWKPAIYEQMGKAEFTIFKNDYDETAESVKRILTAVDSNEEGSFAYRLNETESTVIGNTTTISDIKTKPGEQITGYQTIKERSDLYERVIGKDEEGIKSNMARMVMTDSLFKTEVIKNVPSAIGGRNYVLKSDEYYYTSNYKVAEYDLSTIPKGTKIKISVWGALSSEVRTFRVYINNSSGTGSGNSQIIELSKLNGIHGQGVSAPLSKWTGEATLGVDATKILVFGLDNNNSSPKRVEYVQIETGDYYTDWTAAPEDKANMSSITQLEDSISLKVSSEELLNEINVQAKGILIQSGTNKLNITPDTTYIKDATIKSAMIESLEADKIKTGTLDAGKVKVINIDAENITSNKTSFIQSNWNDIESSIRIDGRGLLSTASDGSQVYLQNGIVGMRNPDGATVGQIGYRYASGSPQMGLYTSEGSHFSLVQRMSGNDIQTIYITNGGKEYHNSAVTTWIKSTTTNIEGELRVNNANDIRMGGGKIINPYGIHFQSGGELYSLSEGQATRLNGVRELQIQVNGTRKMQLDSTRNYMYQPLNMQGNGILEQSDERIKTNIRDISQDSLAIVKGTRFADYEMVKDGRSTFGFIAQQLQTVAPHLIFEEGDRLTYDTIEWIHTIAHGLQQLGNKVDDEVSKTNDEISQLKAQVASLQEELATLKGA